MAQVEEGDTVKVHYTGKFEDGTVFNTAANSDPMQFRIGDGKIITRFEQSMRGMKPGESKIIKVPADNAYGPHHAELVLTVGWNIFPDNAQPEVGRQFIIRQIAKQS